MSDFNYRGKLPFRIVSSSVDTGYNAAITAAVGQNIEIVNQHRDEYGELQDSPLQGPFTEQWVGGNQHRHIPLNQPRLKEELVSVPTPPVSASYTYLGFSPGNEITFTAVATGSAGNNIYIALENLGSDSIGVNVVGSDIFVTIYVSGDGGGSNTSVESLMNDSLNWPDSNQLLTVTTIGSFEFGPFSAEQLTGGSDGGTTLETQLVPKLDDPTDRPEAFLLGGVSNKVRVYGPTHFDINAPKALNTRDNVSKSPVNIKNIRNEARRLGNFSHNYQVIQTSGRDINESFVENELTASGVLTTKFIKFLESSTIAATALKPDQLLFTAIIVDGNSGNSRRIRLLYGQPATNITESGDDITINSTLLGTSSGTRLTTAQIAEIVNDPLNWVSGVPKCTAEDIYFGDGTSKVFTFAFINFTGGVDGILGPDKYNLPEEPNKTKSVFVERFSAPGDWKESSRGALDRESEQYSPNNSLVTRNITVRQKWSSQLTQHMPQFGSGSTFALLPATGTVDAVTENKVNRNSINRPETVLVENITPAVAATFTIPGNIVFTATTPGIAGNNLTISFLESSSDTVQVTGSNITVLFTGEGGTGNGQIAATVNNPLNWPSSIQLFTATVLAPGSITGGGPFNFTGGSDIIITYTENLVTGSVFDNFNIQHSIPRTDLRYKWIADSTLPNQQLAEYQTPYDSSELTFNTSSLVKNGSNNQFEINNSFINSIVKDKKSINLSTNTFTITQPRLSASFSEIANTPFGFSTWREIRGNEHPVAKTLRLNNIISVQTPERAVVGSTRTTRKRSNSVTNFTESPITIKFKPLVQALNLKSNNRKYYFVSTYGNNRSTVANTQLKDILNLNENHTQIGNMLATYYSALDRASNEQNPINKLEKLNYSETLYPKEVNTYLAETRARTKYILDQSGTGSDGYDKQLGTQRVFWRDELQYRLRESDTDENNTFYNSQNYPTLTPSFFQFSALFSPTVPVNQHPYESPFQRRYQAGSLFSPAARFNPTGEPFIDSVFAFDNLPNNESKNYGIFSASLRSNFDAINSSGVTSSVSEIITIKTNLVDNGLSGELNKELFLDYFYSSSIPNSGVLDSDKYLINSDLAGTTRQLTRTTSYSTLYQYIPEMSFENSADTTTRAGALPLFSKKLENLPIPKISYTAFLGGFEVGNRSAVFSNDMQNIYNTQPLITPVSAKIVINLGLFFNLTFTVLEPGLAGNNYTLTLAAGASNISLLGQNIILTVPSSGFGLIQSSAITSLVNNAANWPGSIRLLSATTNSPFSFLLPFTNKEFTGGSDGTIYSTLDSGLSYQVEQMSGKKPWFDSYEKYCEDIRTYGKEYSILPEFRISTHMPYYVKNKGGNFRAENRAFLEIDGTNPSRSANAESTKLVDISLPQFLNHRISGYNQKFIDSYVSSEPLEYIKDFDNQFTNTHLSQIQFTVSGIKKLLPYNGFYPKDRTVQLANLFNEFMEENVKGGYYIYYSGSAPIYSSSVITLDPTNRILIYNIEDQNNIWSKNVVLPYFFSPGILYNTIKSGISVDFPKVIANNRPSDIYENEDETVQFEIYDQITKEVSILEKLTETVGLVGGGTFNKDNLDMYGSILRNGMISSRIPFESLIFPENDIPLFQRVPDGKQVIADIVSFDGPSQFVQNFYKEFISGSLLSIKFDSNRIPDHHTQILYQDSGLLAQRKILSDNFINLGKINHLAVPFAFRTTDKIKNPSYSLAMSNFLAEIPRFFLRDEKMVSFTSTDLQNWDQFELDKKYYFDLKMKKSSDLILMESYTSENHISGNNTLEKTFNGRYFGWPVSKVSGNILDSEQKYVAHNDPAYAPFTPPYFEGEAILRFELTPTSASYANMRSLFKDIKLIEIYNDLGRVVQSGSEAFNNKMPIQSCVEVFGIGFNKQVVYDTQGNPIQISDVNNDLFSTGKQFWSISPKLETPILDFSEQEFQQHTGSYWLSSGYGRGMWSGYGKIPTGSKGITLELADSFPQKIDFMKQRTIQINSQFEDLGSFQIQNEKTGSLLKVAKFKAETKKLGDLAETKEISEAIVMIPYLDRSIQNVTTFIDGHNFFSIKDNVFQKQKTNIAAGRSPIMKDDLGSDIEIKQTSISKMIECMKRYVIPPNFDFITHTDINPFVMFIFEFKHSLDKEDLADIWQGVMPKIAVSAQEDKVVFTQDIGEYELFGKDFKIPENMRWMIFKVKRRAEWNYFAVTENQADDQRFIFNFANSEVAKTPEYSYNWPYDYFSLVELAKVDITLSYEENVSGSIPLQQSITLITNT